MTKGSVRRAVCCLCALLLLSLLASPTHAAPEVALITDYNALMSAIVEAEEGDVLLVGDIDFSPTSPDIANSFMSITVDKSLTIKSGKDGPAVLTNAGFLFSGSKISGEEVVCRFENIIFDGKADAPSLTIEDFQWPWSDSAQDYTCSAPMKAQQALSFKGNVDASFSDCVFRNYMHEYGPIADIRYGDYTDNAYLLDAYGDNSGCRVGLTFEDCQIIDNSASYDGGAIFIDANKNVTLTATDCLFARSRSGAGEFARGGGAIYASGAELRLTGCQIADNIGNYLYEGAAAPYYDTNRGGAIMLEASTLTMTDCILSGNRGSMGGALSLTNTKADMDGCTFTGNRAQGVGTNKMEGPWSNMGQGGAIYVEGNNGAVVSLINCQISDNSAATAYGGLYGYYTPNDDPSLGTYQLKLSLCTYQGNTCDARYDYLASDRYPWASHPGDALLTPYLTLFGCYVVDDVYANDFPRSEAPAPENGYTYLSAVPDETVLSQIIPADEAIGGRYGDKLQEVHVGSNYDPSLYREEEPVPPPSVDPTDPTDPIPTTPSQPEPTAVADPKPKQTYWWIVFVAGGVAVLAAVCIILLHRRRKEPAPQPVVAEKPQIVMTRYDDAQIDRFLTLAPQTQLLTARELEVLREILRGRKQGEVAYQLGIEVTTVKDFYKKIYTKLDVPNKDALLKLADQTLKNS